MAAIASFSVARENGQCQQTLCIGLPGFKEIMKKKLGRKKLVARWRPLWIFVESWKSNQVISILISNFT